jgi:hypothetical protein
MHIADLLMLVLLVISPVIILSALKAYKNRIVEEQNNKVEPAMVWMPDRQYKPNVRALKKYMKSKGYVVE